MILSGTVAVFLQILKALILARILTSWFRPRYRTRGNGWFFTLDDLIWRATEPMLAPIRRVLPTGGMGIDFSPMILWFLVELLGNALVRALMGTGL